MKNPNLFQIGSSMAPFDKNDPSISKGIYSTNKMNNIISDKDLKKNNSNFENEALKKLEIRENKKN